MSSLSKATHIDRDDFDADHYSDWMRDSHRSRITLDQLDIAQRQFRRKEKFLSHIHDLKMKEITRVKHDFIRKIEQDARIANLPMVQETLKLQRRQPVEISSQPNSDEHRSEMINITEHEENSQQVDRHVKPTLQSDSRRTVRLKANLEKFNHMNTSLC